MIEDKITITELENRLTYLEVDTSYMFNHMMEMYKEINFVEIHYGKKDIKQVEYDDCHDAFLCVELHDSFTGDAYDVYLLSVDEHGLYVATKEDRYNCYSIRFDDVTSIYDKILILREWKINLKE